MASSPPPSPVAGPSRQSLDAASASAKKPGRRKLPEEAAEVLSNFFENVSTTPSPGQRKELLAQVTRIPGAEWYSFKNISKWFTSHKKRRSDDDASEAEELGGGTDRICMLDLTAERLSVVCAVVADFLCLLAIVNSVAFSRYQ
ncbi:hypothetical protein BDY19DRAFT_135065 [Irpex rosettiformis]|uniref:Uncharacterized protein n=1 Tax=Irpex rosettiformis TaxID=378272 RepID=A0ACB8U591_9APHY|nr:hypothetical protein BDY19DRAFT_135065 [Irpex rosettiformis]